MFWVYVIYNRRHNRIYIGQTEDLNRRTLEHNDKENSRHKYTQRFDGTWELVYKEVLNLRSEALLREKQLKSFRGREFIKDKLNIPV